MKKALALILTFVMMLSLAACGGGNDDKASDNSAPSTPSTPSTDDSNAGGDSNEVQDVTLKIWTASEELELMKKMGESFAAAHPEYNLTFDISEMGIDEANANLKTDADSAADIFQLASGGVPELTQKGLLLPIGYELDSLRELYPAGAISAVTAEDGLVYAVPFTPNTFFMYYNKSMFTEDEVKSVETMMAKDLGEGVYNFSFQVSGPWYIESFFYAAGCTLFGADGKDASSMDWNNANGFAAGQYMIDLVNNPKYLENKDGIAMNMLREGKLAAHVDGTWNAGPVQEALGENYAAAPLPTININGQDSQLRNFADYKTYAIKSSTAYPLAAQQFAEWICNEENQLARYEDQGVPPCISSLADQLSGDVALSALLAQSEYAVAQPNIPQINEYWTPATALGEGIYNKEITEDNLQEKLDQLVDAVTSTLVS
jgi:arabinogalactan oligomer/maltooligosaccharide transport system substrate-binding protein